MDNRDQENAHFPTLHATSQSVLATPKTTTHQCDPQTAALLAAQLFGFYRASEANDPETFVAGATAMLAQYPEPIVRQVCSPACGLPSECKWLPNIAEIRVACEKLMAPVYVERKRQALRLQTAQVLAPPPPATDESRARVRQAADELIAEFNAKGAARKMDFRAPRSPAEAEAARAFFEARLPELAAEYAATPPNALIHAQGCTYGEADGCLQTGNDEV